MSKRVNTRQVRLWLYGEDRLPVNKEEIYYKDIPLFRYHSREIFAYADMKLVPQQPPVPRVLYPNRIRHRAHHRLLGLCCGCNTWVPLGRWDQHKCSAAKRQCKKPSKS